MVNMLNSALRKIAIYLVPVSVLLLVVSRQVIAVLYERGRFDDQSTIETASIFTIYLFGSFFFSASIIIARSFYAMQNMILPMVVNTSSALITIPLYISMSSLFGARGIAIAAVTGMTLQFVILYVCWNKKYGTGEQVKAEVMLLFKITAIAAAAVGIGIQLRGWLVLRISFANKLIENSVEILLISIAVLGLTFILYDVIGIQKFKSSMAGFIRRK
jgi:putative peptidoglycan lipid II flippase